MGIPIIGVQAAQRALKKKLPRGKATMTITPGWEELETPPPVGPGQQSPQMLTEGQKKLKRLQRT
jgi:hypothetical protein